VKRDQHFEMDYFSFREEDATTGPEGALDIEIFNPKIKEL